ncbi:DUF3592 domain-containing protein [Roseibacterium sp. SDUM158016]|uniref:DUF3592 domain-containing protein n=1 Tax=Roseicyclus sediminis TaxID=2980997 RepID=UPI0021D0CC6D|nr:DUF3592 domain-containing protein [Roseibacterium sp. SDUM158016]MCU4652147.1 DUF3592 domain-containing protein [Roseibacterium sp. SDUM158016]
MARSGIIAWLTVRLMMREGQQNETTIAEMTEAEGRPPMPGEAFRETLRRQYLWTDAQGQRHVGWRVWLLLWVFPALFAVATLLLGGVALVQTLGWERGEAYVRQVYAWEGETPFDRGVVQYSPVLCYVWTDGAETCATPGQRHRDWNFEVGSRHAVLYDPSERGQLRLAEVGQQRMLPLAIGGIALGTALLALLGHVRLRRWQRGGATTTS